MEINVTDSVPEDVADGIMTVHHDTMTITGEPVTSMSESHTIINLPIGKDSALLNTIPTGFMIATGPDGAVYLDAAQLAMLTQNAQISASFASLENANIGESGEEPIIIQDILQLQDLAAEQENLIPREHATDALPEILPPVGKGPFHCEQCHMVLNKWNQFQRHLRSHADDKPHRCDKCEQSFNVESNLTLHRAIHNPDDLSCPACGKHFKRVASLKSHMMLHEKEESLVCAECSDEFTTQTHLTRHMKSHREQVLSTKLYFCKKCNLQFNKASELRIHMKAHYRIKASLSHRTYKRNIDRTAFVHACPDCSKQFQKPSQLLRHSRIHTGERPYACSQCDKTFNQKGALQIHRLAKHTNLKPFRCEFCSASFSQRGNLRSHIQRVHVLSQEGNQALFHCDECPCVFRKLGSLNAHISRMHSQNGEVVKSDKAEQEGNQSAVKYVIKQLMDLSEQVNVADLVGKEDGSTEHLDTHVNLHCSSDILQQALQNSGLPSERVASRNGDGTGTAKGLEMDIEPGTSAAATGATKDCESGAKSRFLYHKVNGVRWRHCLYCSKVFKKPSDLVRHIRTHTHEKPFKCKDCFRSFTVKSTLTAHLRTHSGIKEFGCSVCNKFFSTQGSLNVHNRLHSGARPFKCHYCERQFRTSGHRKNHAMSHFKSSHGTKARRTTGMPTAGSRRARRPADQDHKKVDALSNVQLEEPILITGTGYMPSAPRTEGVEAGLGGSMSGSSGSFRRFECVQCARKFKKSSHLKQHLRSHTGERPYPCSLCQRRFVSGGVLTAHMRTTHLGVKVNCSICQGTFTTNGSLKRHMSTHSEMRPFMCPYCQKTFKTSVNCKKHMKTHRQELAEQAAARNADKMNADASELVQAGQALNEGVEVDDLEEEPPGAATTVTMSMPTSTLTLSEPLAQECLRQFQHSIGHQVYDCVETDVNGQKTIQLQPTFTFDNSNVAQATFEQFTAGQFTIQGDQLHNTLDISGLGETLVTGVNGELVSTNIANILLPPTQESCETQTDEQDDAGQCVDDEFDDCVDDAADDIDDGLDDGIDNNDGGGGGSSERENEPGAESSPSGKAQRRPYSCSYCLKRFKKSSHLKQHLRSHTGEKPFKCTECNRMFVSAGVLKSHQKIHSGIKDFKCTVCASSFTTNGSLTRHFLIHSSRRPFKCSECGEMFRTSIECRRHTKTHFRNVAPTSPEKSSGAEQSPRKPRNPVLLFSEAQTVQLSKQTPEQCATVSEKILIASAVEKDRISEIKDRDAQRAVDTSARHAHQCEMCTKSFKKHSDLVRHLRIHTGEKPFSCELCHKQFTVKSTLDSHLKTHTSFKCFNCHVCNHLFATKGSLKVHMRLHTGSKPFQCPKCELRFRTSGHRASHIRSSHTKPSLPKRRRPTTLAGNVRINGQDRQHEQQQPQPPLQQSFSPLEPQFTHSAVATFTENTLPSVQECDDESHALDSQQMDDSLLQSPLGNEQPQQQQFVQLSDLGTGVQLGMTFPGLDTMATRTFQIDASLLQQLQRHGHLSLTINPSNILTPGIMLDNIDLSAGSLVTLEMAEGMGGGDVCESMISVEPMNTMDIDLGRMEQGMEAVGDNGLIGQELRSTEVSINITESGELVTSVLSPDSMVTMNPDDDAGIYGDDETTIGGASAKQDGHVCATCNRSFSKQSLLSRHLLIHSGERPFKCTVCEKSFNQTNALKIHLKTHSMETASHHCPYCLQGFTQKGNLNVHIRRAHPREAPPIATSGVGRKFK